MINKTFWQGKIARHCIPSWINYVRRSWGTRDAFHSLWLWPIMQHSLHTPENLPDFCDSLKLDLADLPEWYQFFLLPPLERSPPFSPFISPEKCQFKKMKHNWHGRSNAGTPNTRVHSLRAFEDVWFLALICSCIYPFFCFWHIFISHMILSNVFQELELRWLIQPSCFWLYWFQYLGWHV